MRKRYSFTHKAARKPPTWRSLRPSWRWESTFNQSHKTLSTVTHHSMSGRHPRDQVCESSAKHAKQWYDISVPYWPLTSTSRFGYAHLLRLPDLVVSRLCLVSWRHKSLMSDEPLDRIDEHGAQCLDLLGSLFSCWCPTSTTSGALMNKTCPLYKTGYHRQVEKYPQTKSNTKTPIRNQKHNNHAETCRNSTWALRTQTPRHWKDRNLNNEISPHNLDTARNVKRLRLVSFDPPSSPWCDVTSLRPPGARRTCRIEGREKRS